MNFFHYIEAFFAGAFLANFVPHFVSGISGNKFPTPFSKPRGKGLSSPTTNVAWSLFNLITGFIFFKVAKISGDNYLSLVVFFIGIAFISFFSAKNFAGKEKEKNDSE